MSFELTDLKRTWCVRECNFTVEVCHRTRPQVNEYPVYGGRERWNVYAYIYPNHPLFSMFPQDEEKPPYEIECLRGLHLHKGCTYMVYTYTSDGAVKCIQFGSDYAHDGDIGYMNATTIPDKVRADAEQLWKQLFREVYN